MQAYLLELENVRFTVTYSISDEVVKTHEQTKSSYGRLGFAYGGLIISKLLFHSKYPEILGNLSVSDQWLVKNDSANNFELAVDFLDLLERINQMKIMILNTFDAGKSHSLTSSGQCRLSALIPCINDSAKLFDLLSKTLKILHRSLPWDTLSGHRQRFRSVYTMLGELYEKLNTFQYLRGIVQIPRLSGDISRFMKSLHRMEETPVYEATPQQFVEEVDLAASEANDLISVDDSLHTSMAYMQQEYSDLSSKYQAALQMLQEERIFREGLQKDMLEKVEGYKNEIQVLKLNLVESERCNQENLERFEATAKAAEVATATTNQTTVDADKLEKLKAAYQKLRADHITLIREKAEMEKQLKESSEEKTSKNQEIFLEINNLLGKYSFLKSNSASNMSEIKECFLDLDANIVKYAKSAEEKDKIIAQKESDMRLLEFNCSERSLSSKEELRNTQKLIPELEEKLKHSEGELESIRNLLSAEVNQKTELQERCNHLEANLNNAEELWRSNLTYQLQLLSNRLITKTSLKSSGKKDSTPQMRTIYDPNVIPNPQNLVTNDSVNPLKIDTSIQQSNENNQHSMNGEEDLQNPSKPVKERLGRLCTVHDVLFYIMFTIMELQPYTNITENFDITDLLKTALELSVLAQNENHEKLNDSWASFLRETETKLSSINKITDWDPSDHVDKEIYDMQVNET